jgi:hypothetical protein
MNNIMLEQALENLEQYKLLREKFNEITREISGDAWTFTGVIQSMIESQVRMANNIVMTAKFTAEYEKEAKAE